MFERIYLEIGNICNLNCSFCVGTKREKRQMSPDEFDKVLSKIKGRTKFVYLHLMGEPLIHRELDSMLKIAKNHRVPICITTNGVLLNTKGGIILENSDIVHKVSISLHAREANEISAGDDYLGNAVSFGKQAAEKGIFTVFRLWNEDSAEGKGKNSQNAEIQGFLKEKFPCEWQVRPKGFRLQKNIFLEYDGLFTWPAESKADNQENGFCHALSNQLGILVDGTVVPCCLDSEGEIKLGNIFDSSLEEILEGSPAAEIKAGFQKGKFIHPLCKKCTFARKFKVRNN